jgi:hypothetical protein
MWVYVAAALLALSIGFGSGWKVRAWKAGADDVERAEQQAKDQLRRVEHVDQAAQAHEDFKAAAEVRWRTVTKEVEHVVERPVYRNVCLDADGLRILADDIRSGASPSRDARTKAPDSPASRPAPADE